METFFLQVIISALYHIALLYILTASSHCPNIPFSDSQESLPHQAGFEPTWLTLAFGNPSAICDWSRGPVYPGACWEVTSKTADTSSTLINAPREIFSPYLTHRGFIKLSQSKWVYDFSCHIEDTVHNTNWLIHSQDPERKRYRSRKREYFEMETQTFTTHSVFGYQNSSFWCTVLRFFF